MSVPTTKPQHKTLLVLFGILLTLGLLEFGLRVAGGVLLAGLNTSASSPDGKPVYRILCLGESTTMMGGNDSYPRQLERILNSQNLPWHFEVINGGLPGTNTFVIRDGLERKLDEYQPDMVITMMGINDNAHTPTYGSKFEPRGFVFADLRIVKLFDLLQRHVRYRLMFEPDPSRYEGLSAEHADTVKLLEREIVLHPQEPWAYTEMAEVYRKAGFLDRAEKILTRGRQINPRKAWSYRELWPLLVEQGRAEEAEALLGKAIAGNPKKVWPQTELGRFLKAQGKVIQAEEVYLKSLELHPNNQEAYQDLAQFYFDIGSMEKLHSIIKEAQVKDLEIKEFAGEVKETGLKPGKSFSLTTLDNYRSLAQAVLGRGIVLVAVQYPVRPVEALKEMLEGIPGITFVSNEDPFKEVLAKEPFDEYFKDSFAGDFGHCTAKGNHVLAVQVAEAVKTIVENEQEEEKKE